jgi:hypothetical protein
MVGKQGEHFKGRKPAKAGRKKGSVNKFTANLKEMVMTALSEVGGVDYLIGIARTDPSTFCAMIRHVVPKEHIVGIGGIENAPPIQISFLPQKPVIDHEPTD